MKVFRFNSSLSDIACDTQETENIFLKYLEEKYPEKYAKGWEMGDTNTLFYDPGGMVCTTEGFTKIGKFEFRKTHYSYFKLGLKNDIHSSGVYRIGGYYTHLLFSEETRNEALALIEQNDILYEEASDNEFERQLRNIRKNNERK